MEIVKSKRGVKKGTITSLELLKKINKLRKELRHDTLLSIIRKEFYLEINAQKILEVKYIEKKERGKWKTPFFKYHLLI